VIATVFAMVFATTLLALTACAGMTPQDRGAVVTEEQLTRSAYCHLDGGATRALIRAAHDEARGILARNGVDAGAPGSAILCP
jgi:hypothetical protein